MAQRITSVTLNDKLREGQVKRHGFVRFQSPDDAIKVINTEYTFEGEKLVVAIAKDINAKTRGVNGKVNTRNKKDKSKVNDVDSKEIKSKNKSRSRNRNRVGPGVSPPTMEGPVGKAASGENIAADTAPSPSPTPSEA